MAATPELHVVIPTLNAETLLSETLESLAPLAGSPVCVHVVDGGSSDSTLEEAHSIANLVTTYVYRQKGLSLYGAMNFALRRIPESHYVWFLGAGDKLLSAEALNDVLEQLRDSGGKWSTSPVVIEDPDCGLVGVRQGADYSVKDLVLERYRWCHQGIIMRDDVLRDFGGFPENLGTIGDYAVVVDAALHYVPVLSEVPFASYLAGGMSSSNLFKQALRKYTWRKSLVSDTGASWAEEQRSLAWTLFKLAIGQVAPGNRQMGRRIKELRYRLFFKGESTRWKSSLKAGD